MDAILVQAGLGEAGGVTVDVVNLAEGLEERQHRPRLAGSIPQFVRELAASPRALVHVFGCLPSVTTFGALALARARRRPLVWTPIFNPIRRHTWKGYGLLRLMEGFDLLAPRTARFVDAVIAATPAEGEFFAGLGARRVEVIPPGVASLPPPAPAADLADFRARIGVDPGPLVLTVARDNSRKALPFGLAAFAELRRRLPSAQLLLVGPDADFHGGAQPGVFCPGWLDQPSIALAYQVADVLFVPSLYEGLPRAVIEAWRWGTPVVATDRVALARTIDGVGGSVIPYPEADAA
ncbi:MAG: glycosyltransferase family 4 protein, partial [Thermoleophilia bacterium]|nr:glycosyltransferase family 4 protein [Thermoleophilia bacterium]